jgi:DNA helicase-2/ATP-dependent DNA helicase PcrA
VADEKDISMLKAAAAPDPGLFGAAQKKNLAEFASFINTMRKKAETMKPSLLIGELIENTGIIEEYMKAEPFEYETRIENIRELISIAIQYENDGIMTLAELLETVSLVSDVETSGGTDNYVSLMTLHSAKGLEFPVGFICGFEEGIFPSERSALEQKVLEEERRLCYVGITRSMERLYLTCTRNRTIFGKTRYGMISRFFTDIDPEHYEYDEGGYSDRITVFTPSEDKKKGTGYKTGERVLHKRFGRGTVVNITKDGDDTILEIDFEGKGKRSLMEAYANLEKM